MTGIDPGDGPLGAADEDNNSSDTRELSGKCRNSARNNEDDVTPTKKIYRKSSREDYDIDAAEVCPAKLLREAHRHQRERTAVQ